MKEIPDDIWKRIPGLKLLPRCQEGEHAWMPTPSQPPGADNIVRVVCRKCLLTVEGTPIEIANKKERSDDEPPS